MDLIHFVLLFIMTIIGACILWVGSWTLKRAGRQEHTRKFKTTTILILAVATLVLVVLEWEWRTNRVELVWNEEVTIHIKAFEQEAFLDNPTDFDFYLYNSKTGKKLSFDFEHGDWYAFKFYKVKHNSNWLLIKDQSSPYNWVIDWSKMETQNTSIPYSEESDWELIEVATLTPFYNFEMQ